MDTEVGNHMLKTVPMNNFIRENNIKAVINGVRWDEHESRSTETFYSSREDPPHTRIHPILQFTERDVWDATWLHMIPELKDGEIPPYPENEDELPEEVDKTDLPISPKYWAGYRSLGSEVSTEKSSDKPAWMQDVANTVEREGRAQNKDDEDVMNRLRELGYM